MRTGCYSMAELFGNRHIEQLVIPEIQRDYVWRPEHATHLLTSILARFSAWQREKAMPFLTVMASTPAMESRFAGYDVQPLQEEFAAFYARRAHATNIGFLYAYNDGDLPGQYFLIDGQQRLTTLYLSLLAVATRDPELKKRFLPYYCLFATDACASKRGFSTKLDYRLREHTAQFFHRFVRYFLEDTGPADAIREQTWYLHRFDDDTTTRNLLHNYMAIQNLLEPALSNTEPSSLYEYLEDFVECWYFDTNESAQGEELYLYLNARGESIADNENLKARLLAKVVVSAEKDIWGRKWEEWQDYFWQNRSIVLSGEASSPNADRGFNVTVRPTTSTAARPFART